MQVTDRYGTARAIAWDRIHLRLTTRSAWIDHTGELPTIEGTLIRLQADRLPGTGDPLPLWLWSSATGLNSEDAGVHWQASLRRFDIEHLVRLMKQTLGWTRPKRRTPEAGAIRRWRGRRWSYPARRGRRTAKGPEVRVKQPQGPFRCCRYLPAAGSPSPRPIHQCPSSLTNSKFCRWPVSSYTTVTGLK